VVHRRGRTVEASRRAGELRLEADGLGLGCLGLLGVDEIADVAFDLGERRPLSRIRGCGRGLVAGDLYDRSLGGGVLVAQGSASFSQLVRKRPQLTDGIPFDGGHRGRISLASHQVVGASGAGQRNCRRSSAEDVGLDPLATKDRPGGAQPGGDGRHLVLGAAELG
jgi:hypothetical protein